MAGLCIFASLWFLGPGVSSALAVTYTCGNGGGAHCYSIGAHDGVKAAGLEAQWHDLTLTMPTSEVDDYGHIQNEMWLINENTGDYVEMGLARHCTIFPLSPTTCTGDGGSVAYLQFWAETHNGVEHFHNLGTLTADGSNHSYQIWNPSDGANDTFNVYLDFNQMGQSQYQTDTIGTLWEVGLELFSPDGNGINTNEATGNQFHNFIQAYHNDTDTWSYVVLDSTTIHDHGDPACGTTDNCLMDPCSNNPIGQCLNGTRNLSYEWSDYKP